MTEEEKETVQDDEVIEDADDEIVDDDIVEDVDDDKDEAVAEDEKKEADKKAEMDKEERSRQAKARREREAREQAEKEKRIEREAFKKGELSATKVNTFTNEPIKDEYDLKIYKVQKEIEEQGGDPIADLPKTLAKLDRDASIKAKEVDNEKAEKSKAIDDDIKDFRSKYPDVTLSTLLKDPDFADYIDGRLGVKGGKSLAQLYEGFNNMKSKFAGTTKKEEENDGKVTPPSPNGGRKQEQTSYSKLSKEEKEKRLRAEGLIS